MLVYTSYKEAAVNAPYCITMGSFDGVHIGHLKLIETTVSKAKESDCNSMIYTFSEHPKKSLSPYALPELITNDKARMEIFKNNGLDSIYLEDFFKIRNMSAQDFIHNILKDKFQIKCIIAGYNFRFGTEQKGDINTLKDFGTKLDFDVIEVKPVIIENKAVSSSLIRELLKSGDVEEAQKYLGRYFSVSGKVIHGSKRGSKIGIRTANIEIENDIVLPKGGVYFTNTIINDMIYKSVTNIGCNPTFNGKQTSIETHIFDFDSIIYDSEVEVVFLKWLRNEIGFNTAEELKKQIDSDIENRLSYRI